MSETDAELPIETGERTHPLGLLVAFISGIPQLIFPIVAVIFGSGSRNRPELIPLVILGVLLVSVFFRWLSWLRFRFTLDDDDIRIEQGIINRTVRSIPYDRIQDVSIEEKPLARLMGLGEVKFETGGGEGEDAKLSFVSMERAEALRSTVRARKSLAVGEAAAVTVAEAERPPVFAMDNNRLLTLGFYSFSLVIFAVLGGLAQQFDFLLPFDWWDFKEWTGLAEDRGVSIDGIGTAARIIGALFALSALLVVGVLTGVVRTVLKEYGFRLDRTERGFRRRRGFLTRTDVVMPVNRAQAAVVVTGPIRKLRGWHALKFVSLAQDSKEEADFMAAPLAQLGEIWPIAAETGIAPPESQNAFRKSRFMWWATGLIGLLFVTLAGMVVLVMFADAPLGKAMGLIALPLFMVPFTWAEWRNYADLVDDRQLYVREGWWKQRLAVAPLVKVQSAEIAQGPIARMLGLSTLHFGIAGGRIGFVALPLDEARAIRHAVMAQVAPVDFSKV